MGASWPGALSTFQLTFVPLLLSLSLLVLSGLMFGTRTVVIGTMLGFIASTMLFGSFNHRTYEAGRAWLDGGSAALLLIIGIYFHNWFVFEMSSDKSGERLAMPTLWIMPLNTCAVGWVVFVEGMELISVWLRASSGHERMSASIGVSLSLGMAAGLIGALVGTGVLHRLPPYLLKGCAAVIFVGYAVIFLGRWSAVPI